MEIVIDLAPRIVEECTRAEVYGLLLRAFCLWNGPGEWGVKSLVQREPTRWWQPADHLIPVLECLLKDGPPFRQIPVEQLKYSIDQIRPRSWDHVTALRVERNPYPTQESKLIRLARSSPLSAVCRFSCSCIKPNRRRRTPSGRATSPGSHPSDRTPRPTPRRAAGDPAAAIRRRLRGPAVPLQRTAR